MKRQVFGVLTAEPRLEDVYPSLLVRVPDFVRLVEALPLHRGHESSPPKEQSNSRAAVNQLSLFVPTLKWGRDSYNTPVSGGSQGERGFANASY
jgi:hypothetical protein